jgi:DNA-binding PucR family transcriptional regulator
MKNIDNPFNRPFKSLEHLADTISEVLHCPVTLEDANHRLIAYSSHEVETDVARIATIVSRRVPDKVIGILWREGVMQEIIESDHPVRIAPITSIGLGSRVAISIRKHNDLLGFIWVMDDRQQLADEDLLMLKEASQAMRSMLSASQLQRQEETKGMQNFFWQLLTGHLNNEQFIHEQAIQIKLTLPSTYSVIVLRFTVEIDASIHQHIQYMLSIPQSIQIALQVTEHHQMVLLVAPIGNQSPRDEIKAFLSNLSKRLKERLVTVDVEATSGCIYNDFNKVASSYQEAITALDIKHRFPEETVDAYLYEELGYYMYLPLLAKHNQIHPKVNESLRKLRAYDLEHDSNLVQTLGLFLACNLNMKVASKALHVHMNTLTYRLKRISDIGNINLTQMDQIITLYLELKIEQYSKPFTP